VIGSPMTDVLAPVLIPYARFLEVRARRLDIVTELTRSNEQRTNNAAVCPEPTTTTERARVAVRVPAADSAAEVQQS